MPKRSNPAFWLMTLGNGGTPVLYNEAVGGTVTEVADYNGTGETWRVHTFTADGSLEVLSDADPNGFRVLIVGGGGGSGPWDGSYYGGHGGGGGVYEASTPIDLGAQTVTIGRGGHPNGNGAVTSANDSSLTGVGGLTVVCGGGGSGGPGPDGPGPGDGPNPGANGGGSGFGGGGGNGPGRNCGYYSGSGGNLTSDISGTSVTYSKYAGAQGSDPQPGDSGRGCDGNGRSGRAGIVIVAYQIG